MHQSVRKNLILFTIVTFCFTCCWDSSSADETCKIPKIIKRQIEKLYHCGKSLKFKDEHEKEAKMTCVLKCVLKDEKILNEKGHLEQEMMESYIGSIAPKSMKAKAIALFNECRIEHDASLDNEEEFCRTYDPLVKCFVWAAIQVFLDELIS